MAAIDTLPPARDIPNAFISSVKSWWSVGEKQAAISEQRLLRRLPFFSSSTDTSTISGSHPVIATSTRVDLDTPKQYVNTVSITPTTPSPHSVPPTVLLHGYGAGLGFYFRNFPALANWAGRRGTSIYAIDWLGMGRSARVPFSVRARRDDIPGRVHEAESFFIDSLEEWRSKMGLQKMTLVGHSLGAYFSVVYALRYPDRVSRLILLSPAGVPRGPNYTQLSRELTDEGSGAPATDGSRKTSKSTFESATKKQVDEIREEQQENKRQESRTRKLFTYLWEEGWSPFQVVRATMFWGPMLIGKYSTRRFSGLSEDETKDMHDYIMNITLAKGSGEYCICA
ncbi:alpha/beta-hydrolase, partial [Macrolepiota fuliginosa MF-IS2]